MKLSKFLLVLHAAEKGSSFVVRDSDTGKITKTEPKVGCKTKIGGLCLQKETTGYETKEGTEEELTNSYGVTDALGDLPGKLDIDPLVGYVLTKDKSYINLAVMGDETLNTQNAQNPLLSIVAAKNAVDNPALAFALTKDPLMPLATDIANDPTLAVATAVNNPRIVSPQNILLSQFVKPVSAASTYALTGSPLLASAAVTGNKLPLYLALNGQSGLGYAAAGLGNPLLAQSLTGDRQAMYAAATGDPTLSYTAQQMNNPTLAYAMTKDPILAIQKPKPDDGTAQPVNPLLSYMAAKQGDPNLAFALTGDPTTAYASTLGNPGKAALASTVAGGRPILTHLLTKDPLLTLDALAEKVGPDSPALAYIAAKTGDPALTMALTQDPAVAYAAQTSKPGLAGLAAASENPAIAYIASKDPVMMAMASDNEQMKKYAGAMSGKPALAYALTGDIGTMVSAQQDKPIMAQVAQESGSPALAYVLTKDPVLGALAGEKKAAAPKPVESEPSTEEAASDAAPAPEAAPVQTQEPLNIMPAVAALTKNPILAYAMTGDPMTTYAATMDNPLTGILASQFADPSSKYILTKDPVLSLLDQDPKNMQNNIGLNYLAASTGNPLAAYALTGNPAMYVASQHADPLLAVTAAHTNPAAAYLLTKDPVLTMMTAAAGQTNQPAAAKPHDPLATLVTSKLNNVTPVMASAVTGDPNMLLTNQWDNTNIALATAMANGTPASSNPTMDIIAAHSITDPTTTYALTGNPLLASAVASGNGKDIAHLTLGAQANNPLLTYALTKDPKLAYMSTQQNPLLSYTALQTSPALAAIATQDPLMLLLARN